ncbi:MAG TPA: hypothetical protein VNJ53_11245 [Gaiellaceae bacterium]|nr:hypothetical protein [Gaiellaceae bacterium]
MSGLRAASALLAAGVLAALSGGAAAGGTALRPHDVTAATLAPLAGPARAARASAWCGSAQQADVVPNAVAGFPVHWVYALPADGADALATVAATMQGDAEAIDAWWRSQDPTRTLRNDLAPLACGLQLDVTTLRLPQSSAQLALTEGRFAAIANALIAGGFRSPFVKYVVYYDGPVEEDNLCGQGASEGSGFGVAAVYVRSCAGVSTAAVAAHEVLHTLGAVSEGAPNECGEPDDGHTCDDPNDLMYPSIDDSPLAAKALDPGRDDYYGHGGGWPDAQDAPWLVQLDRQAPLALTVSGPGAVRADVPGLSCAQPCTTTWNSGTRLNLLPVAQPGAKLVRWNGACSGAALCALTVSPGASVSALFAPAFFRLTVSIAGRGTVRSSRPGLTCRPRCAATFPSYEPVRLTAAPAKGWAFRRWGGSCRGSRPTCVVPMTAASRAVALFRRR